MAASESPTLRRYVRIPSIVPVDFQLLSPSKEPLDPQIRTGFTCDMSEGGMCLQVRSLPESLSRSLESPEIQEDPPLITVDIALPKRPLRVEGRVAWSEAVSQGHIQVRKVGIEFMDLRPEDGLAIVSYARRAAARPKIVRGVLAVLAGLLVASAGVLWYLDAHHEEAINASRADFVEATDTLAQLYVELRWLAIEVQEGAEIVASQLTANGVDIPMVGKAGSRPPDSEAGEPVVSGPAVDDLAKNVAALRAMLDKLEPETLSR